MGSLVSGVKAHEVSIARHDFVSALHLWRLAGWTPVAFSASFALFPSLLAQRSASVWAQRLKRNLAFHTADHNSTRWSAPRQRRAPRRRRRCNRGMGTNTSTGRHWHWNLTEYLLSHDLRHWNTHCLNWDTGYGRSTTCVATCGIGTVCWSVEICGTSTALSTICVRICAPKRPSLMPATSFTPSRNSCFLPSTQGLQPRIRILDRTDHRAFARQQRQTWTQGLCRCTQHSQAPLPCETGLVECVGLVGCCTCGVLWSRCSELPTASWPKSARVYSGYGPGPTRMAPPPWQGGGSTRAPALTYVSAGANIVIHVVKNCLSSRKNWKNK